MKKKHILNAFFYIIYLIALTEIILRIPIIYERIFSSYEVRFPPTKVYLNNSLTDKDVLYFFFNPDSQIEFNYPIYNLFEKKMKKIEIKTNNYGFRGKNFTEIKTDKTIRIIFLGDSYTFGWGLKDEETYPQKICNELSKTMTNNIQFECLNFAIPGNNIFNSYHIFMNIALKFKPDIVIFGQNINDVECNMLQYDSIKKQICMNERIADLFDGAPYNFKFEDDVLGFSYFYRLISFLIFSQRNTKETIEYYKELYTEKNWDFFNININSLIKLKIACELEDIYFLVLLFPIFYNLKDDYPFKNIHFFLREIYIKNNVSFIDFYEHFKDIDDYKLWVHPQDKHPNSLATSIISAKTVEFLLKNNYLKK